MKKIGLENIKTNEQSSREQLHNLKESRTIILYFPFHFMPVHGTNKTGK